MMMMMMMIIEFSVWLMSCYAHVFVRVFRL